MFRTEKPFKKIATREFYPPGKTGKKYRHQVEALGDGQQFVSHHTHPDTGKPYTWITGSPVTTPVDDLPVITEEEVRKIFGRFEAVFIKHGLQPQSAATPSPSEGEGVIDDDDDDLLAGAPLRDIDTDKLRELVMSIPNDGVPYESNEHEILSWLQMLMAIAHQTGGSEEGREIAYEWSIQSGKHFESKETGETGDEYFDRKWKSVCRDRKNPLTAKYIVKWAKVFRKEDTREKIDDVLAAIELANTIDDLKEAAATACRIKGLQSIDRDLLATAIQKEARKLGARLPINTARRMIQYHGPKEAETPPWLTDWVFLKHVNLYAALE